MVARVHGGVGKKVEGSVVDSGVTVLSWRFLGVLGRGRAKVLVVELEVSWVCRAGWRDGLGRWMLRECCGRIWRAGSVCVRAGELGVAGLKMEELSGFFLTRLALWVC